MVVELHSRDQLVATKALHLHTGIYHFLQSIEELVVLLANLDGSGFEMRVLGMAHQVHFKPAFRVVNYLAAVYNIVG